MEISQARQRYLWDSIKIPRATSILAIFHQFRNLEIINKRVHMSSYSKRRRLWQRVKRLWERQWFKMHPVFQWLTEVQPRSQEEIEGLNSLTLRIKEMMTFKWLKIKSVMMTRKVDTMTWISLVRIWPYLQKLQKIVLSFCKEAN
mgnify:CR=1 FL=1